MKNQILILFSILCATGCNYTVDNSEVLKVADAIHESFKRADTTILRKVFIHNMDSISLSQKNTIAEISSFYNKDLKPIKIDTTSNWFYDNIDMFFLKNNQFFRVRASYYRDSVDRKYYIDGMYFSNMNEHCEEYQNEPYCPTYSIDIKSISWNTDYYGKTFKSGSVELQNNLDQDINYIKLKVVLSQGEYSWNKETFLNQTVESYKPIYSGDIVKIDIPGMSDYYTGFKIEQDKLSFSSELIEVKPKPESYWCSTIDELKDYTLSQLNN